MVKINEYCIENRSEHQCWYIRYPDGSWETISYRACLGDVLLRVLYLISDGIKSIFDLKYYSPLD